MAPGGLFFVIGYIKVQVVTRYAAGKEIGKNAHRVVLAKNEIEQTEETSGHADDPAYEDAVRVVLEMGKASTSTLQRRLRLGYGRAARLLDMMQHEGIIGPPDGSKPREVLKAPDWLREVEEQLR